MAHIDFIPPLFPLKMAKAGRNADLVRNQSDLLRTWQVGLTLAAIPDNSNLISPFLQTDTRTAAFSYVLVLVFYNGLSLPSWSKKLGFSSQGS